MDEKTKLRARAKLEKMDQFIAYSDEFLVPTLLISSSGESLLNGKDQYS
jgi:hypothetical protein